MNRSSRWLAVLLALVISDTTAGVNRAQTPVGKSAAGAPMAAPFAGGPSADADAARRAAHEAAGIEEPTRGEAPAAPPSSVTYEAPPEWEPGPRVVSRSAFAVPREAAFIVKEGDRKAEITITVAGGDVLQNVNRWRGQIELEPITEEQLAEAPDASAEPHHGLASYHTVHASRFSVPGSYSCSVLGSLFSAVA